MNKLDKILLALILIVSTVAHAQEFSNYRDTVNHFSIYVPTGWKYGVYKSQPSIKFAAFSIPRNSSDSMRFTYNLNIIETPKTTLDDTYSKFIQSLKDGSDIKVQDSGQVQIDNKQFKWTVSTSINSQIAIEMTDIAFLTYRNNKTYILTMVSVTSRFDEIKETYLKIANSFRVID